MTDTPNPVPSGRRAGHVVDDNTDQYSPTRKIRNAKVTDVARNDDQHPELHRATIYDTEAGMFEMQDKDDTPTRWRKSRPLIILLVAVGALLVVVGVLTGTMLKQRNEKTNESVNAGTIEGASSSGEDGQDTAKIFESATNNSGHTLNMTTTNEETDDLSELAELETNSSSFGYASTATQPVTVFQTSSVMIFSLMNLTTTAAETSFTPTTILEDEASSETPTTTPQTTTAATTTTVYKAPSTTLERTIPATTATETNAKQDNATVPSQTTTPQTLSTTTSNAPVVPTHDSGNDSCEKAVTITDTIFARTGSLANATPTIDMQECNTTAKYSQGVWYSLVNSKRRIVHVQYKLSLPATPNIIFLSQLEPQGDAVLAMVNGSSCSQCPVSYRGEIRRELDNYDFIWGFDGPPMLYTEYTDYDGLRVYGVELLHGVLPNATENTGVLIIDEFLLEQGEQYLFYLGAVDFVSGGSYEFNMTEYEVPTNEECDAAILVGSLPAVYEGSLFGATSNFHLDYDSDCNTDGRGVWYRLVGSGSTINIDLSFAKEDRRESNVQLSIFGGSCNLLICHYSLPIDLMYETEDVRSHYDRFMDMGETYFLLFSGSSFYDAVNFNLTISQDEAPDNDECSSAAAISFLDEPVQTINGSTVGATPDVHLCDTNTDSRGVWYAFQGEEKLVSITFTGSGWITLFQGLCNELTCMDMGAGDLFTESGVEYRILVEDYFSSDFELIVKQFEPPENDSCESALMIENFPFTYTGDMKGARPRIDDCYFSCTYYTGVWFTFTGTGAPVQVDLSDFQNIGYGGYAMEVSTDECSNISSEIYRSDIYISSSMAIPTETGLTYRLYVAVVDTGYSELPYYISIKM